MYAHPYRARRKSRPVAKMRITLNWPHVALWGRFARFWAVYLVGCLVMGWATRGITPRSDELLFLALLPLPFVAAYALLCLLAAWLGVLMAGPAGPAADTRAAPRRRVRSAGTLGWPGMAGRSGAAPGGPE